MRQVVLDCETTGLEPEDGHRIVEIGCVEIIDGAIGRTFHQQVNPERKSDREAREIHQIPDEVLKTKPLFREIWGELYQFIEGSELIIHNAPFDLGFLDAELERMGLDELLEEADCMIFDTLDHARSLELDSAGYSLDALCDYYAIDRSQRNKRHSALQDAHLLAQVYLAMEAADDLSDDWGSTGADVWEPGAAFGRTATTFALGILRACLKLGRRKRW